MFDLRLSGSTAVEYYAAAACLSRGWQVYWPSNQHTPIDFVLQQDGAFYRVQVKKARGRNARIDLRTRHAATTDRYEFDYLVAVRHYDSPILQSDVWFLPTDILPNNQRTLTLDGKAAEYYKRFLFNGFKDT